MSFTLKICVWQDVNWFSHYAEKYRAQLLKNPPAVREDLGFIPGLGRSLKKGKATHSSIVAWRIPWTV